jgi:hypothetical protein
VTLDAVAGAANMFGGRFFLVSYLPTYAASLFVLTLIWAGAPGQEVLFSQAWSTAAGLSVAEVLLIALAVTLLAVLLQPLQLRLVRLLEGDWPAWANAVGRLGVRRQEQARARLVLQAAVPDEDAGDDAVQQAGQAGTRLAARYPPSSRSVRPTALGNALAAMEERAGSEYGWDAVVAWPRLYPVLGEQTRAVVDDRRNILDAAARLSATATVTVLVTAGLLARSGWWVLLTAVPLLVAALAYAGAVQAAIAYGEAVSVAFDLHRFDLLDRLHLPLPSNQVAERQLADELCAMWRQGLDVKLRYRHGAGEPTTPQPPEDAG